MSIKAKAGFPWISEDNKWYSTEGKLYYVCCHLCGRDGGPPDYFMCAHCHWLFCEAHRNFGHNCRVRT